MRYATEIQIDATPDAVWAVLTNAAAMHTWDGNITKVEGTIDDGQKITVHTRLSDRAFPVKVGDWQPSRRMTWTGGMPLGLFKGVRTFTLSAEGAGTRFSMEEVFSGLMKPLIARSMPDLQPSFDGFSAGLKRVVEGK